MAVIHEASQIRTVMLTCTFTPITLSKVFRKATRMINSCYCVVLENLRRKFLRSFRICSAVFVVSYQNKFQNIERRKFPCRLLSQSPKQSCSVYCHHRQICDTNNYTPIQIFSSSSLNFFHCDFHCNISDARTF